MVMVATIFIGFLYYTFKKREQEGREIMAAIEKGIKVPFPDRTANFNYQHKGLIWTSLGIAFTLALWLSSGDMAAAAWGLIPTAYGVANLLIARSTAEKAEAD